MEQSVKAFQSGRTSKHSKVSLSLISCIILSTLQNFQGDYQTYRLLRSARGMVKDLDSLHDAEGMHATFGLVDKELRPIISRMEGRFSVTCDQSAALVHSVLASHPGSLNQLPPIPETSLSLRSARDRLESVLCWGHDNVLSFFRSGNMETFKVIIYHIVEQWQASISRSQLCAVSSILLEIASLNGLILLYKFNSGLETDFDAYNPVFRRIMDLVAILPNPNLAHARVSFGTETGLIDIILFVGSRCRDPIIRSSALTWLLETKRFEGERLSSDCGLITQAWMLLEETAGNIRQAANIPETSR